MVRELVSVGAQGTQRLPSLSDEYLIAALDGCCRTEPLVQVRAPAQHDELLEESP
jgi:hypothetical protein